MDMKYLFVGIGGMLGSIFRYVISEIPLAEGFPFQTLCINLVGAFCLGWFTTAIIDRQKWNPNLATGIGTGLIGSFTTLSTYSLDTIRLMENGLIIQAFIYIICSSILGLLIAYLGMAIGSRARKGKRHNV